MNVIDFEQARERKMKEQQMIKIPIFERIYEVNGEIRYEVSGKKELPRNWLEKE